MDKIFNFFSMVCGGVGGILIYLFDGFDNMLKALVVLIVLDWITGLLKALYEKNLSSATGFRGIIKKVLILIVIAASVAIQTVIKLPIREMVIMFFLANEGLSLLENVSVVIPVPQKLKNVLEQLRSDTITNERSDVNEKDSN